MMGKRGIPALALVVALGAVAWGVERVEPATPTGGDGVLTSRTKEPDPPKPKPKPKRDGLRLAHRTKEPDPPKPKPKPKRLHPGFSGTGELTA